MAETIKETEERLGTNDDKANLENKVPSNTGKDQTLLREAIQREDLIAIKEIINGEEEVLEWMVRAAVEQGSIEIIQMMLEHGWPVDKVFYGNQTALYFALKLQKTEMVRFLVEKGAEINPTNNTPPPLQSACRFGNLSLVNFLIESGAELDARNKEGFTALHQAASRGHLEIVQYLIEQKGVEKKSFRLRKSKAARFSNRSESSTSCGISG
jgi:hypothetical protein